MLQEQVESQSEDEAMIEVEPEEFEDDGSILDGLEESTCDSLKQNYH